MQYTIMINQAKALEWGLNAQQAMLFAFIHQVPTWANVVFSDGKPFYAISKDKIVSELPLLTDKADTAYRMLKALELIEVIELSSTPKITLVRITDKGLEWNRTSEKNPTYLGKKSDLASEKNPTNHITNNQLTRISKNPLSPEVTDQEAKQEKSAIPFLKIMGIYNEILGDVFKRALSMDKKREANIRNCWNRKVDGHHIFRSADFWREYFAACRGNTFAQGANDRGWVAHLEYVTRESVVTGILEEMANAAA